MKWKNRRKSDNVRKANSKRSRGPSRIPGRIPLAIPIGGGSGLIIILVIILLLKFFSPAAPARNDSNIVSTDENYEVSDEDTDLSNDLEEFLAVVLADTEDVWNAKFKEAGYEYQEPTLVLYNGYVRTACGTGNSKMGPFYCPADQTVYIDPNFYYELKTQFGAPGDFAFAYVLAHEVGHHVQNLFGITDQVFSMKSRLSESESNKLTVRLELQADYLAGVFASYVADKGYLEIGDIDEAINAAAAVGDDKIQYESIGRVIPDKFTHGTSKQRQKWFKLGYKYGDLEHGNTFNLPYNQLFIPLNKLTILLDKQDKQVFFTL